jgi:copper(I)-binding protein
MNLIDRRSVLGAGLALGASLMAPAARACEFYAPNLTIVHPWTRASAANASSAMVCMKFIDVQAADRLIGALTPVAESAQLGGHGVNPLLNFAIPVGQTTVLTEGGTHLRLVGLKHPLQMGRTYPITLSFAKAGRIAATLTVEFEAHAG